MAFYRTRTLLRNCLTVFSVVAIFVTIRIVLITDDVLSGWHGGVSDPGSAHARYERKSAPVRLHPNVERVLERNRRIQAETGGGKSVNILNPVVPRLLSASTNASLDCSQRQSLLGTPRSVANLDASFSDVTCDALLHATSDKDAVYERAKQFMKQHPLKMTPDAEFIDLTKDCQALKSHRGYHTSPVSQLEADFPLAYNLLVHKDVAQIEQLLRAIYRPQNVYCIHMDANQGDTFQQAVRALAACFDNVFVASKLERIVYAGYSRLQADINCMQDEVKHPIQWRYLINTAGQAFPLKTNEEMVQILRIYNGANDIEGIYGRRILKSRFESEWVEMGGKLNKTGRRNPKPPHDIEIVRGSAYGIFSREFVEYIVTDEKAKALLEWSRTTYSPDEHYWATLHHTYGNPHLKTPGGFSGKPDSKPWLAVWVAWGGAARCFGSFRRGTCVFGVQDLPSLLPHPELFANKFYMNREPLTLECLANWVESKVQCEQERVQLDYYRQLPFIKKT